MFNSNGLITVLILALINAQFALTENEYFPGMCRQSNIIVYTHM